MLNDFFSKQFLAFLLAGGTAAMVNFGSRIIYNQWMTFSSAIIIAYITGMVVAFTLTKLFVFKDSQRKLHHSAFYFCLVNLAAIIQVWLISMAMVYYGLPALGITQFVAEISHAIGIVIPTFTSYIGHKHLSFR